MHYILEDIYDNSDKEIYELTYWEVKYLYVYRNNWKISYI